MRRAMEIKELTLDEVFGRMDTNGDGVLSADEFAEGLKILTGKQELDGARLRAVMRELDEDGDDEIDIAEFTKIFRRTETARQLATKVAETFRKVLVHRGGMQQAFEEFDKDKNGTISQQELLQGLRKLGARHISESELMECVAVMDMDGNNEIDYQEFVRACAAAEQTARQKELRERYNTAPLHRLKALCKEQELDSTGLRTELIARLLLAGAEEDESLWDGREPDLEKWQTGADVPDVELEGQQVSIQGMGTGRIIEVEAGGLWAASRHRVELINGDTFNVQLRSKNNRNQSRATAFYVRRDATAVTQAKRRRAMLRLVSPELLRALSKHARGGLGLERALEALDSEGEGALDRNVFLRKVLEAAGGGRFLSADAMHHALASPAALRATEFGGAGSRGLVDYHEFCAALRQLEAQRELAAMIGRAGGVPDDELLPKLISGAGLSNTRGGTMVVGQKDLIQASRSLGITPKLSLSQEAELIELLRASQGLTGARANEFALRSFAQDVRAARVLARREDDAKMLGEALRDRFLVELEEFEEHDGDVVGVLADLDADDDGLLTQEQLLGGVRQLGIRLSAMERRDLAGLMDEDGDGLVDFRELAQHLITTHAPSESRGTAPWGRRRGQLADRPSARAALLLRSAARVPVLWKLLLDNEHELRAACAKLDDGGAAAGCLSRGAFERALLGLEGLGSQHRMHDVIALLDDAAALEKALRQVSSEPGGSDATPAELAKRMFRVTGRRVDQGWVRAALPLLAAGDGAADVDWREFCDGLALLGRTTRLADVLLASFGTRVPSDKDVLRRAFADFDSDSSGTIALGDALVGLWELGLKMRRTDAVAALRSGHSFGRAGDNDRIGWEELVRLLHNRSGGKRVHRSLSAPRLRRQHGDDDHDSANDDEYSSLSQLQIMNQRQRQSSARASGGWSPVRGRSSMREGVARLRSSSVAPPLTEWFDVNTSRSPRSSRVRARRYDTNDTSSSDDSSGDEGFDDVSEYDDRHRSRDRGTSGVRHRSRSRGNTRSPSPRHSERFAQRDRRRSPSRSALRRSSPQPSFSLSPVRRDRAPSAPRPDQLQLAPWLHEATPPPSTRRTRRSSSPARSGSRYAAPDSRVSPGSARVQCALDGNHWMVRAAQREEHYCDECAAAGLTTLGTAWSCADGCDYDLCADCHATLAAPPPPPAGSGHRRRRPQASAGDSTRTISAS
jgi:Ca2+-binding EF-hand superfamily protein